MATLKQENQVRSGHLPEHGPIADNGREILLSLKNVDITFGKGEDAVQIGRASCRERVCLSV